MNTIVHGFSAARGKYPLPPRPYIMECIDYDPATGACTWRHRPDDHFISGTRAAYWNRRWAGSPAGRKSMAHDRYVRVAITLMGETRNYALHRLAWYIQTGVDPGDMEIDHINGDSLDNRFENLRLATRSQNKWNRSYTKGSQLPPGVTLERGRYRARITVDGAAKTLGFYQTAEAASDAYEKAAMRTRGNYHRPPTP